MKDETDFQGPNYQVQFYEKLIDRVIRKIESDSSINMSPESLIKFKSIWMSKVLNSFAVQNVQPMQPKNAMLNSMELAQIHMGNKINKNILKSTRLMSVDPKYYNNIAQNGSSYNFVANDNTGEKRTLSEAATQATLAIQSAISRMTQPPNNPVERGVLPTTMQKKNTIRDDPDELEKFQLDGEFMESNDDNEVMKSETDIDDMDQSIDANETSEINSSSLSDDLSREEDDDVSREEIEESREEDEDVSMSDEPGSPYSKRIDNEEPSDDNLDEDDDDAVVKKGKNSMEFEGVDIEDALKSLNDSPENVVEEEPLNSEDDLSEDKDIETLEPENLVVCQYKKIKKIRNKWKLNLKAGIANIHGTDIIFHKASGETLW